MLRAGRFLAPSGALAEEDKPAAILLLDDLVGGPKGRLQIRVFGNAVQCRGSHPAADFVVTESVLGDLDEPSGFARPVLKAERPVCVGREGPRTRNGEAQHAVGHALPSEWGEPAEVRGQPGDLDDVDFVEDALDILGRANLLDDIRVDSAL